MRRLVLAAALAACGPGGAARAPRGAVVARVDGAEITEDVVRVTAAREGVDAPAALRMLVDEALLAGEARRRGLADAQAADDARWHALVRRLIEVEVEAPNTPERVPPEELDAFLRAVRAQRCHDGLRRVVHAFAPTSERASPAVRAAAAAHAEAYRAALVARYGEGATEAQVRELAAARGDLAMRVEALPGIDRAGGMATGGGVVAPFARAIWAIDPGRPVSPAFETSYGFHVARLVEELPPSGVPCDALRPRLREELALMRRGRAMQALLTRLRARSEFRIDRAALRAAEVRAGR